MTTSKRLVAFVVFPLLFLSLIILALITAGISNSHTSQEGHNVNPTGHLTVETEFGTINIETANRNHVDITVRKIWRSNLLIWRPKLGKSIDELLRILKLRLNMVIQIPSRISELGENSIVGGNIGKRD